MFKGAQLVTYVPDRVGVGGSKQALHTHQANPVLDTYDVFNVFVNNGRWKRELKATTYTGTPQAGVSRTEAIGAYYLYSTQDPLAYPTTKIFAHNEIAATGQNVIYDYTGGSTLYGTYGNCVPATFINIKNQLFIAWGGTQGQIWDTSHTYPRAPIGAMPPVVPVTYVLDSNDSYTDVYTATASNYIVAISPSPAWGAGDVGRRITISGQGDYKIAGYTGFAATAGPGVLTNGAGDFTATINAAWGANLYRGLSLTVGVDTARIASYTTSGSTTTVIFQTALTNAHAGVAYTFTGSRFQLTTNATADNWAAVADVWRGALSWTGDGPRYAYAYFDPITGHISNVGPITPITEDDQDGVDVVLSNFEENVHPDNIRYTKIKIFRTLLSGGVVLFPLTGYTGQPADLASSWVGPGPTFTDTYEDSVLGLAGNLIAPQTGGFTGNDKPTVNLAKTLTGTASVVNGSNVITYVSGDLFSAEMLYQPLTIDPGGANDQDFVVNAEVSEGVLSLGATTFPWSNSNYTGVTGTYTFTVGPFIEYARPAFMAYWDGRVWMAPIQDPGLILFSADKNQCPYGVPEQSYPTFNFRRIPAQDGKVDGMRVVGDKLVITTERYAYYVAGNNETNYRLLRLSTTMYGVGPYQMHELVGDGPDETDSVVYLGRDKKLHAMGPGIGTISISEPVSPAIQSEILTSSNYAAARVHPFAIGNRRGVIMRLVTTMWTYDIERRIWSSNWADVDGGASSVIPQCFGTVYGGSNSMTEIFGNAGTVASWLGDAGSVGRQTAYVQLFDTDFNGKKSKKRLNFVRGYFSNATANTWVCTVIVDDDYQRPHSLNFVTYPDAVLSLYPYGGYVDGVNAVEQIAQPPLTRPVLGTVTTVNGTPTITYASGSSLMSGLIGKTIVIAGVSYVVLATPTTTTATLTTNYVGGTGTRAWTSTVDADGITGYRFFVRVVWPANTTPCDCFAIQACYTDLEEAQQEAM